jgi:hypothetical protein
MKTNEVFLKNKAKNTFDEVVKLINDAIDYLAYTAKKWVELKERSVDEFVKRPIYFYITHILLPLSYAIYADLLIANLPACFMELRLMLDSLAKCYMAEKYTDEKTFFEVRITILEDFLKKQKISTSKVMRDFGRDVGLKSKPQKLWCKISESWAHTRGFVKSIVDYLIIKEEMPPYAIMIPSSYSENDLACLEQLGNHVSEFREILKVSLHKLGIQIKYGGV